MSLSRYLTASAAVHLVVLLALRNLTLNRRARAEQLATARVARVHWQRFESERSAQKLAEMRRMLSAVERLRAERSQGASASSDGARTARPAALDDWKQPTPAHSAAGPSSASATGTELQTARELAARIDRAIEQAQGRALSPTGAGGPPAKSLPSKMLEPPPKPPSQADQIAELNSHAHETLERFVEDSAAPRAASLAEGSPRSDATSGKVGPGSSPRDGWISSIVGDRSADLEMMVRGPAVLAEQRQRWKQKAYDARLDVELSGWETWLKPKRSFLGTTTGVSWFCIDTWYLLGPFDNTNREAHDTHFPPETLIDLDAVYSGKGGRALRWKYLQTASPIVVPPIDVSYSVTYGYTELRSDRERQVWFALGGDDSLKVWLNRKLIYASEVHLKPWVIAEGFARATLVSGYNQLLVRLENAPQGSAFSVSIRIEP